MRCSKTAGVSVIAALVLGATASGASASRLVLRGYETKAVLATGSEVNYGGGPNTPPCELDGSGTLKTNTKATDTLVYSPAFFHECFEAGASVTGSVKNLKISTTGTAKFTMSPKLATHEATGCVYEFSKLVGTTSVPGIVYVTGFATGKLNKKLSVAGCAMTKELVFEIQVFAAGFEKMTAEVV